MIFVKRIKNAIKIKNKLEVVANTHVEEVAGKSWCFISD